ncbi:MAG TPA: corrinoid protein [Methylomirabilota bacterium]|nr:corrinoid protein [Methylomirabilota bacterium]
MIDLAQLRQHVIDGEQDEAVALTRGAMDAGCPPDAIFKRALFPAMDEVGRRMQRQEYFIPEVLLAARTMQACAELLRPLIVTDPALRPVGKVVACTVSGDLHDVGKNLVCLMLEGAGFSIVDLGNNCPPEQVVAAVREHAPDIVALSAMLTTTMLNMRRVVEALEAAGLRDRVFVMVGGAPLDAGYAREIHADFYSDDAPGAAARARQLVGAV